jgi:hypothetical protein
LAAPGKSTPLLGLFWLQVQTGPNKGGIFKWNLPTEPCSAVIVEQILPSPLVNKNFTLKRALPMNLDGALTAVLADAGSVPAATGKCTLPSAQNVVQKLKCPSSPPPANLYTAALASLVAKKEKTGFSGFFLFVQSPSCYLG